MNQQLSKEELILDEILKNTYTVETLRRRFQALRVKLLEKIYQGGSDESTKQHSKDEEWIKGFDKKLLDELTSEEFSRMSEYINKFIASVNSLTIYFVFVPEESQLTAVGGWLRASLNNPRLVFTAKVDPSLIGGCAVVYKGIYKDYSLRAKISANKDKLIGEFRQYFKQ